MTCIEHVNMIRLKTNLLNFIVVWGYCHDTIVTVLSTIDGIEHQSVTIDVRDSVVVVVTIDAAHQPWGKVKIAAECLAHIIIKLVAVWRSMHDDNGAIEFVSILCKLLFHKIKVRNGSQIVVFHCIRVQTNKLDTTGNK